MANSIGLATKFQPILDEVYKRESLTAIMDSPTKPVDNGGAAEVKVFKTSMVGLGTYSRATGYVAGDVTGAWETVTLAAERGRSFNIDRMDNDESLGMAFGTLAGEFIRTQVAPEVDAYRFAKYASATSISTVTPATLDTAAKVIAAVDVASLQLDEDEVPSAGRLLFISSTCYRLLMAAISRTLGNDNSVNRMIKTLDEMTIIPVPQKRFYTAITLDAGASASAGGYSKGAGKDINFMLMHPSARMQATKHANLKIFSPEENQTTDGWLIQYRLYHDAWVWENKVDGIYLHNKA
jgi:hypothetical protein